MSNRKTIWSVIVVLVIVIALIVVVDTENSFESPVKIGVIAPFSGPGAAWGETVKNGATLALEEINSAGGVRGQPIEIIFEDDEINPKKTVSAFQKFVDIDNVVAVVGPAGTPSTQSILPLIDSKKVPTVFPLVGLTNITRESDYAFRIWTSEKDKAVAMEPILREMGYGRVAILTTNQAALVDLQEQFKEKARSNGIEIVIEEIVEPGITDMRSQLTKIARTDFDALFVNTYVGQVGTGAKQARDLGIDAPIFSNIVADSISEIEASGGAMEGAWFPGPSIPGESFQVKYKKRFGIEPEKAAASSYDAVMMLARAIGEAGLEGEKIASELLEIDDYVGAYGLVKFDRYGDFSPELPIKVIRDGKPVLLEE